MLPQGLLGHLLLYCSTVEVQYARQKPLTCSATGHCVRDHYGLAPLQFQMSAFLIMHDKQPWERLLQVRKGAYRQVEVGGAKRSLGHVKGPWRGIGVTRGIGNAKIYPWAGVCLLSLACLIMCLAAGVGILISQSSYLHSPPGKGMHCKEQWRGCMHIDGGSEA